jgi:hypothetical protein
MRIKGWMGRADQTTKIKGMFVRPEQVAEFVARHGEVAKARVIATREGEADVMTVQVEAPGADADALAESVAAVMKLRGRVEIVAPGSLPNDGKVIDDQRHLRNGLSPGQWRAGGSGSGGPLRRVMACGVSLDPGLGGDEFVRRGVARRRCGPPGRRRHRRAPCVARRRRCAARWRPCMPTSVVNSWKSRLPLASASEAWNAPASASAGSGAKRAMARMSARVMP